VYQHSFCMQRLWVQQKEWEESQKWLGKQLKA
jgi:hypothetical protein